MTGGAGLLPYLGTSVATIGLAREASIAAQGMSSLSSCDRRSTDSKGQTRKHSIPPWPSSTRSNTFRSPTEPSSFLSSEPFTGDSNFPKWVVSRDGNVLQLVLFLYYSLGLLPS